MNVSGNRSVADKGLAMVVDDLASNREILQGLLNIEGYRTIVAENGQHAVQLYVENRPDIVFMDAVMPVMDGYEAASRIKALAGTDFVPIIFLSGLSEGDALVKCIEAGGDDFIQKPFKRDILSAKIKSMERIRDLSRTVAELHHKIEMQNRLLLNEQIIAEQIYHRAITEENFYSDHIDFLLRPVSIFGGDMLLTAYNPEGSLYLVLGDFTGHGLTAAVGMLPAAEVFRTMTAKGFSMPEIMAAMNDKLHRLLPTGMFMAGCFVALDKDLRNVSIWNAGMPEVLILGQGTPEDNAVIIKHRIVSRYLALGIVDGVEHETEPVRLNINIGDRILLSSDGVTETTNSDGEEFSTRRYEEAATLTNFSLNAIMTAVDNFRGKQPFGDDVSMVEISCVPGLHQTNAET